MLNTEMNHANDETFFKIQKFRKTFIKNSFQYQYIYLRYKFQAEENVYPAIIHLQIPREILKFKAPSIIKNTLTSNISFN